MLKHFEDGSRFIVDELNGVQIIHMRFGANLNFIYKLVLTDGKVIQNMQYELNAKVPTPKELLQNLEQLDGRLKRA